MPLGDINQVMEEHVDKLMALPGVVGVYVSARDDGTPCIKVMVSTLTPSIEARIPKEIEGFSIVIMDTGEIVPYPRDANHE